MPSLVNQSKKLDVRGSSVLKGFKGEKRLEGDSELDMMESPQKKNDVSSFQSLGSESSEGGVIKDDFRPTEA